MPRDDERARREAVRAFDLVAATLANPVPKLMADLTTPEERLRELERELPLSSISPFGTLPDDIANHRDEPIHPPTEATTSDAGLTLTSGGAEENSIPASPGARPPAFSFRRSGATGPPVGWRDRDAQEGPMDAGPGHFHVSGMAQEDPERPVNSAYQETSAPERPAPALDYENEDFSSGALLLADSLSLLDSLAEDVLGVGHMRDVPLHPSKAPPRTPRSRAPGTRHGEVGRLEGPLVSESERIDATDTTRFVGAADPRKVGPDGGGVDAVIGSLVEDLFSSPSLTSDDLRGSEPYASELADPPGEPVAPDHSTLAALDRVLDEPDGGPSGAGIPDDEMLQRVPKQYADPEAFANLINDVLVRQARRHGVDLS